MRRPFTIAIAVVSAVWLGFALFFWNAGAQTPINESPPDPGLPPNGLISGAEIISVNITQSPVEHIVESTYANPDDTARVVVRLRLVANPMIDWGRLTTVDAVNNVGLGIVPAWKPPAGFDLAAFVEASGCADARLVATDTPRADVDTGELGYTEGFQQPAADHPITGELALCLTDGGVIVQVVSLALTDGEAIAPTADLVAATVAWLAVSSDEPSCEEDGVERIPLDDRIVWIWPPNNCQAECEAGDGQFRVQSIVEGC